MWHAAGARIACLLKERGADGAPVDGEQLGLCFAVEHGGGSGLVADGDAKSGSNHRPDEGIGSF
jgi:hypothetical protein